jgi:signal transduction histidine kinase
VLGNVGFMERDLARATDVPEPFVEGFHTYVKVVGEGARRMRDIVRDLKTLARGDEGGATSIDLPRTKLVKDYRDPVTVFGIETRLGQVFLNLLVNAGQAIPEGNADANEVRLVLRADGASAGAAQVMRLP